MNVQTTSTDKTLSTQYSSSMEPKVQSYEGFFRNIEHELRLRNINSIHVTPLSERELAIKVQEIVEGLKQEIAELNENMYVMTFDDLLKYLKALDISNISGFIETILSNVSKNFCLKFKYIQNTINHNYDTHFSLIIFSYFLNLIKDIELHFNEFFDDIVIEQEDDLLKLKEIQLNKIELMQFIELLTQKICQRTRTMLWDNLPLNTKIELMSDERVKNLIYNYISNYKDKINQQIISETGKIL